MEPFIHLHVHTQYSLLDGQASIDALIDKAQKDGMPAIAVTDHGVMFGIKEFFNKVSKKNGKPLGAIKDYEKELKELKSKTELTAEEQARLEEIPAKIEEEKKKIFKPQQIMWTQLKMRTLWYWRSNPKFWQRYYNH